MTCLPVKAFLSLSSVSCSVSSHFQVTFFCQGLCVQRSCDHQTGYVACCRYWAIPRRDCISLGLREAVAFWIASSFL